MRAKTCGGLKGGEYKRKPKSKHRLFRFIVSFLHSKLELTTKSNCIYLKIANISEVLSVGPLLPFEGILSGYNTYRKWTQTG